MLHVLSSQQRFFNDVVQRSGPSRLLDSISENVIAACWIGGLLRGGYTGPVFQAYRVSDGALLDIGARANGLTDTAAISNFGAAQSSNVIIKNVYDQSTSGRVFGTSGTIGRQPVVYEHGVGLKVGSKGYLAGLWISPTYVVSSFGGVLTGNPEIHVAYDRQANAAGGICMRIGDGADLATIACKVESATVEQVRLSDTAFRNFTSASNLAAHAFLMSHAAGASVGAITLRRDGVQLAEASNGLPTTVPTSIADSSAWGVLTSNTLKFDGLMSHYIVIASPLTVANRTKIENWQATYRV